MADEPSLAAHDRALVRLQTQREGDRERMDRLESDLSRERAARVEAEERHRLEHERAEEQRRAAQRWRIAGVVLPVIAIVVAIVVPVLIAVKGATP